MEVAQTLFVPLFCGGRYISSPGGWKFDLSEALSFPVTIFCDVDRAH
jgi:hypothetical protein